MKFSTVLLVGITIDICLAGSAMADIRTEAAQEAAEYALKKFGLKLVQEGTESLSRRIIVAAAKHGDDLLGAVRRVGPKALSLADEAGENAPRALRFLTQHGDDAVRVLGNPKGMSLFARYGDDAAKVLMRHKGIAEPLVEKMGKPAIDALSKVGPQAGRRLAILADSGELAAIGRTPELMAVIASRGDAAMSFVWRNKGALAVGTTLTAFLANPQAFIDGTNQLVETVAENAVKPVVQETARAVSWLIWTSLALLVGVPAAGICFAIKHPHAATGIAKTLIGNGRG